MKRAPVLVAGVIAGAVAMLALAGPASAHVTVDAPGATKGGYAVLTFRVPNEETSAHTTGVRISLPASTPIASVSVQPHAGWTFTTKTSKLAQPIRTDDGEVTEAVTEIDWTADSASAGIGPGEFDEFRISAGPLPDTDTLTLPVVQSYSDGSVVRWIETPAPGTDTEPEHPAPTLRLAASTATPAAKATSGGSSDNTAPVTLSIVALALAAAALSIAVITRARLRSGRPT